MLDSRPLGGAWVLDRLWERLGIGAAITTVAAARRADAAAVQRVILALVANRALVPCSKLAATSWAGKRVFIDGLAGMDDDAAYRAMDFLLDALDELAERIFFSVANLLNLEVDLIFFDTARDDLASWNLNRVVWALDRGFCSAENRRYLQRGGGHYIMGEKLRGAAPTPPPRSPTKAATTWWLPTSGSRRFASTTG